MGDETIGTNASMLDNIDNAEPVHEIATVVIFARKEFQDIERPKFSY